MLAAAEARGRGRVSVRFTWPIAASSAMTLFTGRVRVRYIFDAQVGVRVPMPYGCL